MPLDFGRLFFALKEGLNATIVARESSTKSAKRDASAVAKAMHSATLPQEADVERLKGVLKWFNSSTRYGFIGRDDGTDLFVHFSAIRSEGYKTLQEGDTVKFEIAQGPNGLQAIDVKVS